MSSSREDPFRPSTANGENGAKESLRPMVASAAKACARTRTSAATPVRTLGSLWSPSTRGRAMVRGSEGGRSCLRPQIPRDRNVGGAV